VDNDGNTLLVGALYFNSSSGVMSVWSGSAWVAINLSSSYSEPTIGSTTINSGAVIPIIEGLTKLVSNTFASLDADSKEIDITLMNIMGGY
jgi:hypothetical protein